LKVEKVKAPEEPREASGLLENGNSKLETRNSKLEKGQEKDPTLA
jgi:hypothetical protein